MSGSIVPNTKTLITFQHGIVFITATYGARASTVLAHAPPPTVLAGGGAPALLAPAPTAAHRSASTASTGARARNARARSGAEATACEFEGMTTVTNDKLHCWH